MSRRYYRQPDPLPPTYESHLLKLNADALKRLARFWVGKDGYKMNKEACAKAIVQTLADPRAIGALIDKLSEFERAGLGLLKLHGPITSTDVLAMELLMLGLPWKEERPAAYHYGRTERYYAGLNRLLEHGLILLRDWDTRYSYSSGLLVDEYRHRPEVFSDKRLLARMEIIPPAALSISPVLGVPAEFVKRPAEVLLRFVALTEALRKVGRIDLTAKGRVSKPSMTKLSKALGWEEALPTESHTPLPNPALFFFKLLETAGLLRVDPSIASVEVGPGVDSVFERPYTEQADIWMRAYVSMIGWVEHKTEGIWYSDEEVDKQRKVNALRAALRMALAALPDPAGWYRLIDLSESIYGRVGERFSLDYLNTFWAPYNAAPAAIEQKRRAWQRDLHKSWIQIEQAWIERIVQGPLFHLGLVELACEPGQKTKAPALFRLTDVGRAATWDIFRAAPHAHTMARTPRRGASKRQDSHCWVIQPNFDVIVYLDRASAARLAFIERVAERKPSQGPVALYHLTGETVYQALESGIGPEALVATLAAGSEYPLSDNVRRTLEDWVARRERITVYRTADLLEFPDQATRDMLFANKGLKGTPVGDRFLLLTGRKLNKAMGEGLGHTVDYHQPLFQCLRVEENGHITIDPRRADLLVRGEMACWAEPGSTDGNRWQLTRFSIQRAVTSGWRAEDIIDYLSRRAQQPIPKLLLVAIQAWADSGTVPTSVIVASDLILQVIDEGVAAAVAASVILQPYLRSRLGPKTFLVRHETAEDLCRKLAEYGLTIGADLELVLK